MVVVTLAGREPENDQYIKHTTDECWKWCKLLTFTIYILHNSEMTMTSLKEKEKPDNSDSFNLFSAVFKQKSMFNFIFLNSKALHSLLGFSNKTS